MQIDLRLLIKKKEYLLSNNFPNFKLNNYFSLLTFAQIIEKEFYERMQTFTNKFYQITFYSLNLLCYNCTIIDKAYYI